MTQSCSALFEADPAKKSAWEAVAKECEERGEVPQIESVLSRMRSKLDAAGTHDKLAGLSRADLASMEAAVCAEIVRLTNPDLGTIVGSPPHERFANWLRAAPRSAPVEVFTTNYDLLLETYLERAGLPIVDGFVGCVEPFFLPDVAESTDYIPAGPSVCVWKLHGSINWSISKSNSGRIVRTGVVNPGADAVILPSHRKYDESRKQPYITLLDRLSRFLRQSDALLVTIGYSFADQHINSAILGGLQRSPRAHVLSLQFEELSATHSLRNLAAKHAHLAYYGPKSACRGCRPYQWDGMKETPEARGFLLGDFDTFCDFLGEIVTAKKERQ